MKENLVEILRQLLAGLRRNLWYTISTTSSYEYNLQAATSLNAEEYETLLLASGIMVKKGDTTVYSNSKLEYLQGILRGRLDIHICRSKIDRNGIPLYFIAVEHPTFRNPSLQAKAEDLRVLPNRHGNGLDEAQLRFISFFIARKRVTSGNYRAVIDIINSPSTIACIVFAKCISNQFHMRKISSNYTAKIISALTISK